MIGKYNPLNIRYSGRNKWLGQTGHTRGFCDFDSYAYCFRAGAYLLLRSYRKRGIDTVNGIISVFAPVSENDTDRYIRYVCNRTGFKPNEILSSVRDYSRLLSEMSFFESQIRFVPSWIELVIRDFKINVYEKK